ncbi:Saccharopine dehydrogenase-domain-containing protein [Crucibulum laeve]|uniref:Saccharopine dehydrogenase-domain-containing protein n=1 Tax=Crucibulum laeve TaxID=68775 RepID=A0A5C3LV47_9AGAR|nr:Saccharopine dehydrogenase-domain-containing protein [Crucibulum laeve]
MVKPLQSIRHIHQAARRPVTLGIRREDPKRIWERRVPLTPDAVNHLIAKKNVEVLIEHCDRRIFRTEEYVKAGAKVADTLKPAHITIGIKEVPFSELITAPVLRVDGTDPKDSKHFISRSHLMFSHTIKGQAYNTPLLAQFVAPKGFWTSLHPRLIDYELLTNEDGKRTVGFGWFAGVAGVLESLSAMAHSHLELGIASPFLYTPRPHTLPSLERLRTSLREIGAWIAREGTPGKLGPFVIGLTGNGKVAEGCLSMLAELPIQRVTVKDLDALVSNPETDLHKIYLLHAKPEDYLVRADGQPYNRDQYYASPDLHTSIFAEKIAPYLTLFLNGTGWSPGFPRLMTNDQLPFALDRAKSIGGARFTNIGDISCDVEGGLEFLTKATTLSEPFYKVRPKTLREDHPSVQIMSVDILPSSIPLDASQHFSFALLPYLESVIDEYANGSSAGLYHKAIEGATVASSGKLAKQHQWLRHSVGKYHAQPTVKESESLKPSAPVVKKRKRRVVMLGSGMVAGPAVDLVAARSDVELIIASNSLMEFQKCAGKYAHVQHRVLDIKNEQLTSELIKWADLVISLLPATMHVPVAELCIAHKKHMVTASYISPAMKKLNGRAEKADIIILNEIGLDPGIDHCSAIDLLERLRSQNKEILSFTSYCGGLPAPEVSTGPLPYKFSWSPLGVLTAVLNDATFQLNKKVYTPDAIRVLKEPFKNLPITNNFELEGIPNRNSLDYSPLYNLPLATTRTLFRGTLRYPGYTNLMSSFRSIGLLNNTDEITLENWGSFIAQTLSLKTQQLINPKSTMHTLRDIVESSHFEGLQDALEWIGLIPTAYPYEPSPMPPLPDGPMKPIEILAYLLSQKLRYEPGERDMVVMSHEVITRPKHGRPNAPEEIHTSQLITYGTSEASAMARTVGIPVAIAALAVLDGQVSLRGVQTPRQPSIYKPVLDALDQYGLGMKETSTRASENTRTVEWEMVDQMRKHNDTLL